MCPGEERRGKDNAKIRKKRMRDTDGIGMKKSNHCSPLSQQSNTLKSSLKSFF
jgi:hypothetical protein